MEIITFYSKNKPYFWLTNFQYATFYDNDGKKWTTSEHYFQAQKFIKTKPEYAETIRLSSSPWKAKTLGKSKIYPIDEKWEEIKVNKMKEAVYLKFTRNKTMKEKILLTGDSILVLMSGDPFWGVAGLNMLGCILMEVREEIRKESYN